MQYNPATKRVTQVLGTIYSGDLEGSFEELIERMKNEYAQYKKNYVDYGKEIEATNYRGGAYLDGSRKKWVRFDRVYLSWGTSYDDDKVLQVIGERNYDANELVALTEKEQLRKLKEKYPDA